MGEQSTPHETSTSGLPANILPGDRHTASQLAWLELRRHLAHGSVPSKEWPSDVAAVDAFAHRAWADGHRIDSSLDPVDERLEIKCISDSSCPYHIELLRYYRGGVSAVSPESYWQAVRASPERRTHTHGPRHKLDPTWLEPLHVELTASEQQRVAQMCKACKHLLTVPYVVEYLNEYREEELYLPPLQADNPRTREHLQAQLDKHQKAKMPRESVDSAICSACKLRAHDSDPCPLRNNASLAAAVPLPRPSETSQGGSEAVRQQDGVADKDQAMGAQGTAPPSLGENRASAGEGQAVMDLDAMPCQDRGAPDEGVVLPEPERIPDETAPQGDQGPKDPDVRMLGAQPLPAAASASTYDGNESEDPGFEILSRPPSRGPFDTAPVLPMPTSVQDLHFLCIAEVLPARDESDGFDVIAATIHVPPEQLRQRFARYLDSDAKVDFYWVDAAELQRIRRRVALAKGEKVTHGKWLSREHLSFLAQMLQRPIATGGATRSTEWSTYLPHSVPARSRSKAALAESEFGSDCDSSEAWGSPICLFRDGANRWVRSQLKEGAPLPPVSSSEWDVETRERTISLQLHRQLHRRYKFLVLPRAGKCACRCACACGGRGEICLQRRRWR